MQEEMTETSKKIIAVLPTLIEETLETTEKEIQAYRLESPMVHSLGTSLNITLPALSPNNKLAMKKKPPLKSRVLDHSVKIRIPRRKLSDWIPPLVPKHMKPANFVLNSSDGNITQHINRIKKVKKIWLIKPSFLRSKIFK